jgi:hypothetical protein
VVTHGYCYNIDEYGEVMIEMLTSVARTARPKLAITAILETDVLQAEVHAILLHNDATLVIILYQRPTFAAAPVHRS